MEVLVGEDNTLFKQQTDTTWTTDDRNGIWSARLSVGGDVCVCVCVGGGGGGVSFDHSLFSAFVALA